MKNSTPLLFRTSILLNLLLVVVTLGHGQSSYRNKLIEELKKKNGNERIDLLNTIAGLYLSQNPERSLEYSTKAYAESKKLNYKVGEGEAFAAQGSAYLKLSQFDKAVQYFKSAHRIFVQLDHKGKIAGVNNKIGEYYSKVNLFDSALYFYQRALSIAESVHDKKIIARANYNIGTNFNYQGDYQNALIYYDKSLEISNKLGSQSEIASTLEGKGHIFRLQGKYDEGLTEFHKSLLLYQSIEDSTGIAGCYSGMGQLYTLKGSYEEALSHHVKSLTIFEALVNKRGISQALNSIGIIHFRRMDFKRAVPYFHQSIRLLEEIKDERNRMSADLNLASCYNALGKYDSALLLYKHGLAITKKIKTKEVLISLHNNIGLIYSRQGKYDSALYYFDAALSTANESGNKTLIVNVYNNMGNTLIQKGEANKAIMYCEKAAALASELGSKILLQDAYHHLSEAYAYKQDHRKSLLYYKLYHAMKDSLMNEETSGKIAEMEVKFQTERKDKELALHRLISQEQKITLAKQNGFIIGLILFILILIVGVLYIRVQQRKKRLELKIAYEKNNLRIKKQLELAELKSEFFTNISHEFRTPLTLILTPLEQMMKASPMDGSAQQYEVMYRNANRLLGMINQILELSKIESGQSILRVSRYDIVSFIKEVLCSFYPLAEAQQIQVQLVNELTNSFIYFDKEKLERVLYNLLSNAFKYTPPQGAIIIYSRAHSAIANNFDFEFPEGYIEIAIKDSGKGIPQEHIPYIFNRFYQVEGSTESSNGIGLSLVREIVNLHYGAIQVKSEQGIGTEFSIKLPLGMAHLHPDEFISPIEEHDPFSQQDREEILSGETILESKSRYEVNERIEHHETILIIEDNVDVRNYIASLLSNFYHILLASDGKEGMEMAMEYNPDLVISDIVMPSVNGYTFTAQLKSNVSTSHIPVILLTAKVDHANKLEGLGIGADDYITKPFHADELLVRSKNLISQRKNLRKLFSESMYSKPEEAAPTPIDKEFIAKATKIVHNNLDNPDFDVERFCKEIGMSHASLHKKLKAVADQSVTRFVRCIRLRRAVELIEKDAGSMSDIATASGFNNRQFFIRSFKEQYGMTPTEYRSKVIRKNANVIT